MHLSYPLCTRCMCILARAYAAVGRITSTSSSLTYKAGKHCSNKAIPGDKNIKKGRHIKKILLYSV